MQAYIYKITNLINNKVYIGKTERDPLVRWREHRRHAKSLPHLPLYRAMNKYGQENFLFEVIETCDVEILNEREQYWIDTYNSYIEGYNCTLGGDGSLLVIPQEEIETIIMRYQSGERLDYLCKEFHHDYLTLKRIFNEQGITVDTQAGPKKLSKRILAIDPVSLEIVASYDSISAAGRALCEPGKNPRAIANHIGKYKNTKTVSHGFLWRTEDFFN